MARTTIVQVVDDLDGSTGAHEVRFSFDGVDYEIDLSKKNRAAFEKAIRPYRDAARKVPRERGRAKRTARAKGSSGEGRDLAAIRA